MKAGCVIRPCVIALLIIIIIYSVLPVGAHAPLDVGQNEQRLNATIIPEPEKSYVIYSELHEGNEAHYYQFAMENGQALKGSLMIPGPGSMVPSMIIIGPGVNNTGDVPAFIDVPPGSGAKVIHGNKPGIPSFEPFTPQPVYEVARYNETVTSPGDYYVAVYSDTGGKYSLAPGSLEQFTVTEWLTIPYSVISIHTWEGQSLPAITAPFFIVVIAGLAILYFLLKKAGRAMGVPAWIGATAGLFYLGGAAVTAMQLVHAASVTGYSPVVLVTVFFISVPVILGIILVKISTGLDKPGSATMRTAIELLILGVLGLLFWAGFIAGPLLAIVSGIMVFPRGK